LITINPNESAPFDTPEERELVEKLNMTVIHVFGERGERINEYIDILDDTVKGLPEEEQKQYLDNHRFQFCIENGKINNKVHAHCLVRTSQRCTIHLNNEKINKEFNDVYGKIVYIWTKLIRMGYHEVIEDLVEYIQKDDLKRFIIRKDNNVKLANGEIRNSKRNIKTIPKKEVKEEAIEKPIDKVDGLQNEAADEVEEFKMPPIDDSPKINKPIPPPKRNTRADTKKEIERPIEKPIERADKKPIKNYQHNKEFINEFWKEIEKQPNNQPNIKAASNGGFRLYRFRSPFGIRF